MSSNKFINFEVQKCGFTFTFDKNTTQQDFENKMKELGMSDWKVFGGTDVVYFYQRSIWQDDEETDEETDEESDDE